ncbi:MAG: septum formation initiator family protein [Oscillospiraceae bacterium]|nr:septum formation initiator family protein [Oscillospiraceae bacterium]
MQVKKAGFLTKIVVLALLIYMATSLLNLRARLQNDLEEKNALASQVEQLTQENTQLADAIENKDDPDVLEAVARDKGFVKAGEKLFVDVAN